MTSRSDIWRHTSMGYVLLHGWNMDSRVWSIGMAHSYISESCSVWVREPANRCGPWQV